MNRRFTALIALVLLLTACATTPPDPRLLSNAEQAVNVAREAGAEEFAPLELQFASERLEAARFQLDNNQGDAARRLADESEIEAQLALARTRAAQARARLAQLQRELDQLRNDLIEAFGDEVIEP
ncbi:MAG: DUF4398 domain-containing protein [Wenzhouxiangella sp.]|jgi:hypothetical protein|nr:DUF4398 domain-containing protein [Wenzhouxiangella sp.]